MKQESIVASLPAHLRPFVQIQDYGHYTPRDQAVWRFIMRQLTRQLQDSAHPVYREGLARTGIALDHIPSIDEMNEALAALGWSAVVVNGFIPPAIFMEFQALKILVIALDMRSVDHIFYTPAPDIVHESAGHAPFIVDVDYAEFLQRFGEVGMKAISTAYDFEVYEAVRELSIVKECPASTEADIQRSQEHLEAVLAREESPSEAALLTRLHWWTVEYGLVGEVDDYRIFGAGLLSSLGESQHCLDDQRVAKLPLTVNAVEFPYDITSEQPQLFVTKSCRHLSQVLEEFAAGMCFRRGGADSLRKAIEAGTVCTAQFDSGMQVSGRMVEVMCDAVGNPVYLRTEGPTQLAWRDREIYGQGIEAHPEGFGSPVGLLKDFSRCLSDYTVDELKAHDIRIGERVTLEFLSGVIVVGELRNIVRQEHRNLILSFEDCRVTDLRGRVLFDPAWGRYDMAVGARVDSVFGGTADRDCYRLYDAPASSAPPVVVQDEAVMALYKRVEDAACGGGIDWRALATDCLDCPDEWLLHYELLQALPAEHGEAVWRHSLLQAMSANAVRHPDRAELIEMAAAELPEQAHARAS
ncbi:aromatic amino acid hydroxylase [Parahaliea maris]|uniref:Aromatic amino acid hydroxylase n=1 Tax=Parahaliea maris TaxID=2716870 RepID=A0A5C8ZMW3_9GAMM|nr:aromatic amino acid hydroxylase [Parahaliea maris]TXS89846.1 aromatic amino acid hydroxylase [Parahaliea maris]